jgi:WD40 repeat protein
MSTITRLHEIDLNCGHVTKPCWSADGRFLAIPTQSGAIAIFDLATKQVTRTVGSHSGDVTAVTWDLKAEFILTGSLDRSVGLWEVSTGRRAPLTVSGHKEPVHSVEWTDEEAIAMTCSADRIRVLDGDCLHTGWTEEMEEAINNKSTAFVAASCSHRTTFLLAALGESGSRLVLANALSADLLDTVRMTEPARCLAWSPEEELVAVGAGHGIFLFHATHTGFEGSVRQLTKDAPQVFAVAFSRDGTALASADAQGLKFWNVESGQMIAGLHEENESLSRRYPPAGIAFHPTEPLLAMITPNGDTIRILDLSSLVKSRSG